MSETAVMLACEDLNRFSRLDNCAAAVGSTAFLAPTSSRNKISPLDARYDIVVSNNLEDISVVIEEGNDKLRAFHEVIDRFHERQAYAYEVLILPEQGFQIIVRKHILYYRRIWIDTDGLAALPGRQYRI